MSIKPAKNPVPRDVMRAIRLILAAYHVKVEDRQFALVDEVGDEYATFAVLYVKDSA